MTGLVISGFGLSAFLFSSIAHIAFPGNTSDFLLLLALGTSLAPLVGLLFLRVIPHSTRADTADSIKSRAADSTSPAWARLDGLDALEEETEAFDEERESSRLVPESELPLLSRIASSHSPTRDRRSRSESLPLSPSRHSRSVTDELQEASDGLLDVAAQSMRNTGEKIAFDLHGMPLFKAKEFWLIFSILCLRT